MPDEMITVGICAECELPIEDGNEVVYSPDFIVCKPCEVATAAGWEADKKMLKDQGIAVPCDFFERQENQ